MAFAFNPITGKLDLVGSGGGGGATLGANTFTATQTVTAAANTSALTASYSVTGASTTPLLDLSGTWNTTGVARGILLNVTDTASNALSLLADFQVGSSSQFRFTKGGDLEFRAPVNNTSLRPSVGFGMMSIRVNSGADNVGVGGSQVILSSAGSFRWSSTSSITGTGDLFLARDAANTLALRNGTAAQTFRLYNTFTDASNFERGFMRWNANVLEIGTEAGGTGMARQLNVSLAGQANPLLFQAAGTGVRVIARDFSTGTMIVGPNNLISGLSGINYTSGTADPTTSTISSGNWQVHRNTTSGVVKLWANNAGTLVSVALA
jgi:hypothetical protein